MGMEMFQGLIEECMAELKAKNEAQTLTWGLGNFAKSRFDRDAGLLLYSNPHDDLIAVCPVQLIGTYEFSDGFWLWAWANTWIPDKLKADSLKVKEFGEKNGLFPLTSESWKNEEHAAFCMLAVATKISEANGGTDITIQQQDGSEMRLYFTFRDVLTTRDPDMTKICATLRERGVNVD